MISCYAISVVQDTAYGMTVTRAADCCGTTYAVRHAATYSAIDSSRRQYITISATADSICVAAAATRLMHIWLHKVHVIYLLRACLLASDTLAA